MPSPYSDDFREKAIAAVDRGEKKSHICRMLGISRNTLDLWLKARAETGSFKAKRNYSRGPAPKIKNLEEFSKFACINGGKTQQQMAERWPEKISRITIGKALKRIGFTRKKKTYGYRERNEEQRAEFIKYISKYAYQRFVYVDEAGVDDTEDYPYGWCEKNQRYYDLKLGHKTERISMVAASCCRQIIAPITFTGYCNTQLIKMWVEFFLVPELLPGQIVRDGSGEFSQICSDQTIN